MQSDNEDVPEGTDIAVKYSDRANNFKEDDTNDKYFLTFGILGEENEKDCIDIEMIDPGLG